MHNDSAANSDLLRSFQQYGLVGMAISTSEQRWVEVNDRLVETLGYSSDELIQMYWADVTHPDDRTAEHAELDKLLEGVSDRFTLNKRFIAKSGRTIYATVATMGVRSSDGSVNYLFSQILDITKQTQNERVLSTRLRLVEKANHMSSQELLQAFMDEAETLTESHIGFFHFLDEDQETIHLQVWSSKTRNEMCVLAPEQEHYPLSQAGVWVDCARERRPVIHNDYASLPHKKGYPEGHAHIVRELVVPVFRNDKIVAILGVGNKATLYDEDDVNVINELADLAWDIVLRRRAEELQRNSEILFRGTFEQAAVAVALVDPAGCFLRINQRTCEMLGYTEEELLTVRCHDVTHPDDVPIGLELFSRLIKNESHQFTFEKRYLRKDGTVVWGNVSVSLVRDSAGEPDYIIAVIQDNTSRKQVEEALRRSEERFRTVADFTYDWEFWVSEEGQLKYVSPSCQRISGYTRDAFFADPDLLTRILHPEDRDRILDHMRHELTDVGLKNEIYRIIRSDGEPRWIEHVCQPVYGPDGRFRGRRAGNRDITDRIKAEQERKQLQLQLIHAQKMEAVGTLAAGVAHDFNNALTAIIGHAEIARLEAERGVASTQNIDGIMAAAKRAAGIARSMLTFSRGTPTNKVPVNLNQFLDDSTTILRRIVPAIIDMQFEFDAVEENWVLADTVHLDQILMNLVVNARDAMPKGGRLTVRVEHQPLMSMDDWPMIIDRQRGVVILSVTDTCAGMSDEVLARVCDPFFTTKPRGQGTGLGMSIVHGIVENHGGQISIDSNVDEGTRVMIAFPTAQRSALPRRAEIDPRQTQTLFGNVLIADDNEQVRAILTASFEDVGCNVIQANDGSDALKAFEHCGNELDLVVLDVDMPKIRSIECLEQIRHEKPDLPAILISGFHEYNPSDIEGANVHFLRKPFKMQEVTELASDLIRITKETKESRPQ